MTTIDRQSSVRPLRLVREIVDAIHNLTASKPPPYVVSIDEVARAIGDEASAAFNDAVAFAVRAQLIVRDQVTLPSSVSLTDEGLTLAQAGGYMSAWWLKKR